MAFGGQVTEQDFSRKTPALQARTHFRATSVELFRHLAPCRANTISRPQTRAVLSALYQVQHSFLLLRLAAKGAVQTRPFTVALFGRYCQSLSDV